MTRRGRERLVSRWAARCKPQADHGNTGRVASRGLATLLFAGMIFLPGCGQDSVADPASAPPTVPVGVIHLAPEPTGVVSELPGRIEATRIAEVRARIPGIVLRREFREGSDVKAGQVLFRIDPAPLKADVESARAQLQRAEAALRQSTILVDRYGPLMAANAISRQAYDDAQAGRDLAQADVAAARAALNRAQLNLGYATVEAPITGRIGRALVTEGALVGQGEATPMARIQQLDPVYVNFTQPVVELTRLRKRVEQGSLRLVDGAATVKLLLDDGSEYAQPGKLLFSDASVDPDTGQVTLRASFPNARAVLLPGMYVRVRLEQGVDEQALRVPQQAVQRGADGHASVWIVDAQNRASQRRITTGAGIGDDWIVTDGLAPGDVVVVDGMQKIRPDLPVAPVPWVAAPAAGTPAPEPATTAAS